MSRYIRKRYIDAEALKSYLNPIARKTDCHFLQLIDNIPTADVEEIRHGVWKDIFEERVYTLSRKYAHKRVCSICDNQANKYYSYCPNCGAKMDGDG